MSAKVDQTSAVEPHMIKMSVTSTTSAAATSGPKVSMFAKKSGFVIPKNKLSGSLVPIFRGGKKPGGDDTGNEGNSSQVLRKTKWGPDMTQDAAVRKGRALAYQNRVDQITTLLSSGNLDLVENHDLPVTTDHVDDKSSSSQANSKKSELLEIERREIIGEILKLNPSYKAPPDYNPLLKEATVPIPVKEYPGYNFIGLIFGPGSDTQKRFEKETGAKVQVHGLKANSEEKVEISSPDGNEAQGVYEELYVQISADTFEKVDAAVALIELLITSISGNFGAGSTPTSISGDNVNVVSQTQDVVAASINMEVPQLAQASPHGQFQYQSSWLPTVAQPSNFSSPILNSPVVTQSLPSNMPSLFGPRPASVAAGYNSFLQNPSFVPASSQLPTQILSQPYMLQQAHPLGHTGLPRNFITAAPNRPAQSNMSSALPVTRPLMAPFPKPDSNAPSRPLLDQPVASTGWSGAPHSLGASNMGNLAPLVFPSPGSRPLVPQSGVASGSIVPPPSTSATFPRGQSGPQLASIPSSMAFPLGPSPLGSSPAFQTLRPAPVSGAVPVPAPLQSSSPAVPALPSPNPTLNLAMGSSTPVPSGAPLPSLRGLASASISGSMANFASINLSTVNAQRTQHPSFGDFTFQPHQPQNTVSQMIPRPSGLQSTAHAQPSGAMVQLQSPQGPFFRFTVPASAAQPVMQVFPRLQGGNQMGQPQAHISSVPFVGNPNDISTQSRTAAFANTGPVAASTPASQMGSRNFVPAPQMPNMVGHPPLRMGNLVQLRQNYPTLPIQPGNFMPPNLRPANSFPQSTRPASGLSGGQQIYDPFSPTSVSTAPQQLGGGLAKARKQESDPEFDDLMASVGVK